MLTWKVFEITTVETVIHGVMLRGRLRKLALERGFDLLVENATDKDNYVRFAVVKDIEQYLWKIIPDARVDKVLYNVLNPVLSKLKVNIESRYRL